MAELRERMPAAEWLNWGVFHGRRAQQQEMRMLKARR